MSNYTVQLRWLIENNYDIGLSDYPIFDENHRTELNQLIIESFYTREICAETPALFKLFMSRRMRKIMPLYNQLYASQVQTFNNLYNLDITEVYSHNILTTNDVGQVSKSIVDGDDTSNAINVHSATPNGSLTLESITGAVYADDADHTEGKSTTNQTVDNTSDITGTTGSNESYNKTTKGVTGIQYADAVKKWRETMINIDQLIIDNELGDLFMSIY